MLETCIHFIEVHLLLTVQLGGSLFLRDLRRLGTRTATSAPHKARRSITNRNVAHMKIAIVTVMLMHDSGGASHLARVATARSRIVHNHFGLERLIDNISLMTHVVHACTLTTKRANVGTLLHTSESLRWIRQVVGLLLLAANGLARVGRNGTTVHTDSTDRRGRSIHATLD